MTADTAATEKSSEVQIQNGGDIEAESTAKKVSSANGGIFREVSWTGQEPAPSENQILQRHILKI